MTREELASALYRLADRISKSYKDDGEKESRRIAYMLTLDRIRVALVTVDLKETVPETPSRWRVT